MKNPDFKLKVQNGIKDQLCFHDLLEILKEYKDTGGSQKDAIEILEKLRYEMEEFQEDRILELLDIASGFCLSSLQVW